MGDSCGVMLVSSDGESLEMSDAIFHRDPEVLALLRDAFAALPHRVGEGLAGRVAATGEPLLLPVVVRDELVASASARFQPLTSRLDVSSPPGPTLAS